MIKDCCVGSEWQTNSYGVCIVMEYNGSSNVRVRFDNTGNECVVSAGNLRRGLVKDVMAKSVCGVGYLGQGRFPCRLKTLGAPLTKEYAYWQAMMRRVYSPQDESTARIYRNVTVCSSWHNFQNFAEWCQTQAGFGLPRTQLDKDLLTPGNEVYGPDYCCFLPQHINCAITGMKYTNSTGFSGVECSGEKYTSSITINGTDVHIGSFDTAEKASALYVAIKTAYVKTLAEVYREVISEAAYQAIISWAAK